MNRFTTIALLLLLSSSVFAQGRRSQPPMPPGADRFSPEQRRERQPGPEGRRPPDGSARFVASDMRFNHKLVKGAPFSAVAETETTQPLMDGSKITRKTTAQLYRDSEGRTRREQTLGNIGPFATSGDASPLVFIDDPVAGVSYMLDTKNQKARKMSFRGAPPPGGGGMPPPRRESRNDAQTEALGKQMIEGVEADGTRSTITIPAGQIGNEKPLEIVSERWYSPALQEVILSRHRDPRLGEHTYRLTQINRGEPAATLFQPPAEYTLTENQRGRGPGGPRKRPDDE